MLPNDNDSSGFIDESDCWSPEDDEISQQYSNSLGRRPDRDTISMMSLDSCDSRDLISARSAADIRRRLSDTANAPKTGFKRDPEDPSAAALKEPWSDKVRESKWERECYYYFTLSVLSRLV